MTRKKTVGLAQTFAWPLAMGVLTLGALIVGLLGSGLLDVLAAIGLAAPTVFCVWKLSRAVVTGRRTGR